VLRDAGIADGAQVFTATRTGPGDATAMAGQAWDLAAIEREYEQFLAAFGGPPPLDAPPRDALAGQIALVHAWRRFPAIDPALPRELLPERWSGLAAASLFAQRHTEQAAEAQAEWNRLNPA
jgi:phenylacetic acid degradation operon negative regulatory protein